MEENMSVRHVNEKQGTAEEKYDRESSDYGKIRQHHMTDSTDKKGSKMKNVFIAGSVILILLLAIVHFADPDAKGVKVTPRSFSGAESQLCRQIDELEAKYHSDCRKLMEEFSAALEKNVSPDFARASNNIPKVVDDLCGFGVSVKLCYKAAKDKMTGSHDFLDAYMSVMNGPVIQPCVRANAVASDMLQTLQLRLSERHSQYVTDLAAVCKKDDLDGILPSKDLENLQHCLEKFAGSAQKLHLETVMAGVAVVFEAFFIRETCKYIVKLFAKPAARICGSLGVAGICAVADGPLPIGEIAGGVVAVGGLAWTAWDIYDVTSVMPKKLNSELRNGIAATRTKLLEESSAKAQKIVQAYQDSGSRINRELKEQLK